MKTISERVNDSLPRIKTVSIASIDQVYEIINGQLYDSSIQRFRSPFFYRGISNVAFSLQNTLQRNCGNISSDLESVILRNFAKYAVDHDPQIMESVWRQMMLGQHHGLPTRLLDWTYSPLVALHFAVNDSNPENIENTDCVVWRIDCRDVINNLPSKYMAKLKEHNAYLFTVDMIKECATDLYEYDVDMKKGNAFVLLEPPSIDQRIINQLSYFTITPNHIDCLEEFVSIRMKNTVRYVISKNLRWQIRDLLDQINVNERTLFPGFDGLASWLKRYYYVKR